MGCITIITSTLNCASALSRTADSIRGQTYKNIQWIVADGGSNDGTLNVINANGDIISCYSSERDSGIYDAWNKACKLIRGDWVIFLGAGDVFSRQDVLELVSGKLEKIPMDVVIAYGNVVQEKNGKEIFRYGEVDLKAWEIYRPKLPAHQGVFQRAEIFGENPFDIQYKVAADSKFMLQALKQGSAFYFNIDVCIMEPGGISSHPKHAIRVMKELFKLEGDVGYVIPVAKRIEFIFRIYLKAFFYELLKFFR